MTRLLAVAVAVVLATAGGSGGWYAPAAPASWADRRHPMGVSIHLGRLDSGMVGTNVMSPVSRGVTYLRPGGGSSLDGGPSVGVKYEFLGCVPAGDRYRIIRTVPFRGNNPEVTTAVVVFNGAGRQVVFAAADHAVTVEPPGWRP